MHVGSNQEPLIAALFSSPEPATQIVEQLIAHDFPMDQISLLHHAGGHGDDFLGIAYSDEEERYASGASRAPSGARWPACWRVPAACW